MPFFVQERPVLRYVNHIWESSTSFSFIFELQNNASANKCGKYNRVSEIELTTTPPITTRPGLPRRSIKLVSFFDAIFAKLHVDHMVHDRDCFIQLVFHNLSFERRPPLIESTLEAYFSEKKLGLFQMRQP